MNIPSPAASIPYSGQWCCKALRIRPPLTLRRALADQRSLALQSGSSLCSLCCWCDELHHMPVRVTDEDTFGKTELTGCQGDNAWRQQGEPASAYLLYRRLQITRDERGLPVHQVVGAGIGRERAPVAWRQIFQAFTARAGGGPERRNPQTRPEDVVQVLLFRAIVLTLTYHCESKSIPVKFQTVFRIAHDNGGMINAEEELLWRAMPFRVTFVRRKLQDFEWVAVRIFEVKGLNARGLGVPLGEPLGTARSVFDLVLP